MTQDAAPLPPDPPEPLPEVPEIPPFLKGATSDEMAFAEQRGFAQGNLEEVAGRNEHTRRERLLDNMAWAAVLLFWFGVAIIAFAVGAVAWHYLLPECWAWLSPRQLEKVQAMLLSGTVFSLISSYAQRYMKRSN